MASLSTPCAGPALPASSLARRRRLKRNPGRVGAAGIKVFAKNDSEKKPRLAGARNLAQFRRLCYCSRMSDRAPRTSPIDEASRQRRLEMQHLQAIEGNPLSPEQIEMFEMFEREGWSPERRLAHLRENTKRRLAPQPVE